MSQFNPDSKHDLIIKQLTGEASEEEMTLLAHWVEESKENNQIFEEYRKTWSAIGQVKGKTDPEVEADWKVMEAKLDMPLLLPEDELENSRTNNFPLFKVAAAVAILVVSAMVLFLNRDFFYYEKLATEAAEIDHVQLADGSEVTLNAHSVFLYPEEFEDGVRKVKLKGEAFFEVAHQPENPFVVELEGMMVRVVGTSFNIEAYPGSEEIKVTVKTGKVAIYKKDKENEQILLSAGNVGVYSVGNALITKGVAEENVLAWKTKKLVFEDTPLGEVVRQLNKTYHVQIIIRNEELNSCPISVEFDQQSLEAVLHVLESTLDLQVEKHESHIEIDGDAC